MKHSAVWLALCSRLSEHVFQKAALHFGAATASASMACVCVSARTRSTYRFTMCYRVTLSLFPRGWFLICFQTWITDRSNRARFRQWPSKTTIIPRPWLSFIFLFSLLEREFVTYINKVQIFRLNRSRRSYRLVAVQSLRDSDLEIFNWYIIFDYSNIVHR